MYKLLFSLLLVLLVANGLFISGSFSVKEEKTAKCLHQNSEWQRPSAGQFLLPGTLVFQQ